MMIDNFESLLKKTSLTIYIIPRKLLAICFLIVVYIITAPMAFIIGGFLLLAKDYRASKYAYKMWKKKFIKKIGKKIYEYKR